MSKIIVSDNTLVNKWDFILCIKSSMNKDISIEDLAQYLIDSSDVQLYFSDENGDMHNNIDECNIEYEENILVNLIEQINKIIKERKILSLTCFETTEDLKSYLGEDMTELLYNANSLIELFKTNNFEWDTAEVDNVLNSIKHYINKIDI